MHKKGWIIFLILLGIAGLLSCGQKDTELLDKGELVYLREGMADSA